MDEEEFIIVPAEDGGKENIPPANHKSLDMVVVDAFRDFLKEREGKPSYSYLHDYFEGKIIPQYLAGCKEYTEKKFFKRFRQASGHSLIQDMPPFKNGEDLRRSVAGWFFGTAEQILLMEMEKMRSQDEGETEMERLTRELRNTNLIK